MKNIHFLFLKILHIFNDGYQTSFLLLLPFIAKDLHINLTQIGSLGSLFFLFETLFALPAGYLGEKFDGVKIVIFSALLYGLSYFLLSFASSFTTVIILFVLAGVGFALFHPIAFALVARWSPKQNTGRNIGDFAAIGDLGRVFFSVVITFFIANIGWRSTSLMYALMIGFIFVLSIFFIKKRVENKIKVQKQILKKVTFIQLLKNRKFMLACLTALFDSTASSPLFIFLPFLLIKKGVDPVVLGSYTAAYFVGNFLGKSIIGRLTDRIGGVRTFIIAELLMAVFIVLLTNTSSFFLIIIFSVILGSLTKGTIPARASMAIEAVKHHGRYEKSIALLGFIVSLGTTSAPLIYGKIADTYGIVFTFYTAAVLAILAIIPAVGFTLVKNDI